MKWMLVLFATYMLMLPCIPCNAAEVCCEKEEASATDCGKDERPCASEEDACAIEVPVCERNEKHCSGEEQSCPAEAWDHHEQFCSEEACNDHEQSCSAEMRDSHEGPCSEKAPDDHEHSASCPCCPSFSCNTCHSVIVSGQVLEEPIILARSFDNTSFADKPLANFPAIIWQPPKGLYFSM